MVKAHKTTTESFDANVFGSDALAEGPYCHDLFSEADSQAPLGAEVALRLGAFTVHGAEHEAPIKRIQETGSEVAGAYTAALERVSQLASGAAWLFPDSAREMATASTQALIANATFAIDYHLQHGQETSTEFHLRNGTPLDVRFSGAEPLYLLDRLAQAYWVAGEVMRNPDMRSVTTVDTPGFRVHRFVDISGKSLPSAALYVRPQGDKVYDPKYEYGRKSGVEASVSLRIHTGMLDEHRGYKGAQLGMITLDRAPVLNDEVISIRNDRDGVHPNDYDDPTAKRDPEAEYGTMSHDVGSVFGKGMGTNIGRLLAFGNYLRSQAVGEVAGLNHLACFDPALGEAENFARYAAELEAKIMAMRATPAELRRLASIGAIL